MKEIFMDINDMDEKDLEKAFKFYEKLVSFLCFLGFHSMVDDDGDIFCQHCNREPQLIFCLKKDNFITKWIKEKFYWIDFAWRDYNDPYANY